MTKKKLLFVGSFPVQGHNVFGGFVTDCKVLLDAGLSEIFNLKLIDSTQRSIPPPNLVRRLIDSLFRIWAYFRLLVFNPDAILILSSSGFSFIEKSFLVVIGHFGHSRLLFFPRGGKLMDDVRQHPYFAMFARLMLAFPHMVLCQEKTWRDFFVNEIGVPAEKCVVMKSWTATKALLEIGAERIYGEETPIRILFLGWLDREKGIFDLIDAFAELYKRFSFLELNIAGEGEASRAARLRVKEHGLFGSVKFLGWVTGEQKINALSTATIFCLPSRFEGLPNAMIEAMAAGLPVIVTPVGAIPDVISDKKNGLITPIGDTGALAANLKELITNHHLREQLGREAHQTAAREFTPEHAISHLLELIGK
jgi:glycosyltransferase involved in cell wall biosynthesis